VIEKTDQCLSEATIVLPQFLKDIVRHPFAVVSKLNLSP
jgi:hypothetical protein